MNKSICNPDDNGCFLHGTKAQLNIGDLITPGYNSNYSSHSIANFVYFTGSLDAAIWGAELAIQDGEQAIYIVEALGDFEDDPNLTNQKFVNNPTRSYRTKESLKIIDKLDKWIAHPDELLAHMKENIEEVTKNGIEAINE